MIRVLLLAACFVFGLCSVAPPPLALPESPADFDHCAAWQTLSELAREPHPIGTAAHARARELVVAKLAALGLAPQVQRAVGLNGHATTAGLTQNVLARWDPPGGPTRDAILLATHYDSRIAAPGAGDDGAAVAALLDVMRALKAGPPLARSVIFLCTDGEEQGLLGAEAFVSQHPWAKDVGVVLNFEARGTRGPALLFETSEDAGGLVRVAEEVGREIVGTSLAGAVYRTMPNDTDLSVFLRAKYGGLNFAFNQGWEHYHTRLDDVAHLDPQSLAHHGRIALALTRRLGRGPLPPPAPDLVYFNLLPGVFVVYSTRIAQVLAAVLVLALAFHRGRHDAMVRSLALAFIGVALAVLWAAGVALAARWLHGSILGVGDALRSRWYHLAILIGAAGLAMRGDDAPPERGVVALASWTVPAVATAIWFPPASYLFAWPALGAAVGLVPSAGFIRATLIPASAFVMLGMTVTLFFESLGNDPVGAGVTGLLVALTVQLAVGLGRVERPARAGNALFALGLAALGAAALWTRPTAQHPDQLWLAYAQDSGTGDARWLAMPQKPSPWAAARLGDNPEISVRPDLLITRARAPVAHAPAPKATLVPPEVTLVAERAVPGGRALTLRVKSLRGAPQVWMALPAPRVRSARIEDRDLPPPLVKKWGDMPGRFDRRRADPAIDYTLEAIGIPPEGFELTLTLNGTDPVTIRAADVTYALPPEVAGPPPPETLTPWDFGLCTLVTRTFSR